MRGGRATWAKAGRTAGLVALGAVMLMAVTVAIGRPTVFTDTDDYFSQGRDVARAVRLWALKGEPPINPADVGDRLHDPGDQDEEPVHNQNGARSVYYGLLLWALESLGTLWLFAAAQAALAASVVYALWRTAAPTARDPSYLGVMAALAAGSSLPVFTGFAMPDLFAGFAVAATLMICLYPDRFGRWGKAGLWLLLLATINFHGSNLLTSLGLSVLALAWLAWRRAPAKRIAARAGAILAAVAVSTLAAQAYAVAIKLRTGDDLGRPPFLTARVLADGPGRAYLRHACAPRPRGLGERWALCPYRNDPLDDTDTILWSDDPGKGVFNSADYHQRVRIEKEQISFVLHAVAYQPLREGEAMLTNWGRQLISVGYSEPLRDPAYYLADEYWRTTTLKGLLLRAKPCDPEAGTCVLNVAPYALAELDAALALAALVWLGVMMWDERGRRDPQSLILHAFVVFLPVAVVLNAAVCGMLSGPFDRYQARVMWLVPTAALLLHAARRARRDAEGPR